MGEKGFSTALNLVVIFVIAAIVMIAAVAMLNGGLDNILGFADQNVPSGGIDPFGG